MSIRTRVIVIVAVSALVGWVLLVVSTAYFAITGAERLERQVVGETLVRVKSGLAANADNLGLTAEDWATWDDSYRFVTGDDPGFPASKLDSKVLRNINVDTIIFTDLNGRVLFVESIDPKSGGRASVPTGLLSVAARNATATAGSRTLSETGILSTSSGLMFVTTRPIRRSSAQGPPVGTLTVARRIGPAEVAAVANTAGVALDLFRAGPASEPADVAAARAGLAKSAAGYVSSLRGPGSISGYEFLYGADGQPAAILRVTERRSAMETVRGVLWANSLAMLAVITLILALLGKVIDIAVLRRFSMLSREMRDIGDPVEVGAGSPSTARTRSRSSPPRSTRCWPRSMRPGMNSCSGPSTTLSRDLRTADVSRKSCSAASLSPNACGLPERSSGSTWTASKR